MSADSGNAGWPLAVRRRLEAFTIDADDHLDAAWRHFDQRFGRGVPRHIAAYRGYADHRDIERFGRVLAEKPQGGPGEEDDWWDNLLNTYRRFDDAEIAISSGHEGYYAAAFDTHATPAMELWANATVSVADGTLATPQPVLQVSDAARATAWRSPGTPPGSG